MTLGPTPAQVLRDGDMPLNAEHRSFFIYCVKTEVPSSHVVAMMPRKSHWRCPKHSLNLVQQEVVHEA
jgi:hypothetical protein